MYQSNKELPEIPPPAYHSHHSGLPPAGQLNQNYQTQGLQPQAPQPYGGYGHQQLVDPYIDYNDPVDWSRRLSEPNYIGSVHTSRFNGQNNIVEVPRTNPNPTTQVTQSSNSFCSNCTATKIILIFCFVFIIIAGTVIGIVVYVINRGSDILDDIFDCECENGLPDIFYDCLIFGEERCISCYGGYSLAGNVCV